MLHSKVTAILKLPFEANCCRDNLDLTKMMPFREKITSNQILKKIMTIFVLLFFSTNVYQKLRGEIIFHLIFALKEKRKQF